MSEHGRANLSEQFSKKCIQESIVKSMHENNQESRRERSQRINQESIQESIPRVSTRAVVQDSIQKSTKQSVRESIQKSFQPRPIHAARERSRQHTHHGIHVEKVQDTKNKNSTHNNDDNNNKNTPSGLTSVFSCPDASCMLGAQLRHGTGHC